jgi:hypothetical protein
MMNDGDFPALFRCADAASLRAQRLHLSLTKAHLGALVVVSLVSGMSGLSPDGHGMQALFIAVIMAIAIVIALLNHWCRFKQKWFQCRAVAETVKSAAWRYVMKQDDRTDRADAAVEELQDQLRDLSRRFPGVRKWLTRKGIDDPVVSNEMRSVRALGLNERRNLYLKERLKDQRSWYADKAKQNVLQERAWLALMVLAQAAALVWAYLHWRYLWRFNAIGALSAVAAAFVAWTQTKRHAELGDSYAAAAADLEIAEAGVEAIRDEGALGQFVEDVEGACSREHSLWLARRGA